MKDALVRIAKEAAQAILEVYSNEEVFAKRKADNSPVTEADLKSEAIIRKGLLEAFDFPVVSEETPVEYSERKPWNTLWLVDPLDGTKNFLARDDQFTINIGLVKDGAPIAGLVMQPVVGTIYFAQAGKGALRIDQSGESKIENLRTGPAQIALSSRFHHSEKAKEFMAKHGISEVQSFGSALKHCMMAEGRADVYPRFVGTMEWDTAAAHCILNEAGCKMLQMETGDPLVYNKESLRNPSFIACRADLDFF